MALSWRSQHINSDEQIPYTEVERCMKFIEKIGLDRDHPLIQLIKRWLQNNPDKNKATMAASQVLVYNDSMATQKLVSIFEDVTEKTNKTWTCL